MSGAIRPLAALSEAAPSLQPALFPSSPPVRQARSRSPSSLNSDWRSAFATLPALAPARSRGGAKQTPRTPRRLCRSTPPPKQSHARGQVAELPQPFQFQLLGSFGTHSCVFSPALSTDSQNE